MCDFTITVPVRKNATNTRNFVAIYNDDVSLRETDTGEIYHPTNMSSTQVNRLALDISYFTTMTYIGGYWYSTTQLESKDIKHINSYFDDSSLRSSSSTSDLENYFLQKLQIVLENNYRNVRFTLDDYAQSLQMSYIQFYRKLKALTHQTPSQYIRTYRLEQAKKLLKNPAFNISEVAYEVGFSDSNYFTRAFSKEFGMPPNAYRRTKVS